MRCYTAVGFYLSAAAALLCLIAAIVYGVGFKKDALVGYYSVAPTVLLCVGFVLYAGLEAFKATSRFAPKVLWGFVFAGFLAFVSTSYMYLSGIFYNGVSGEAIAMIDPAFMTSAVLLILSCVIGNVAIWFGQTGKEKDKAEG